MCWMTDENGNMNSMDVSAFLSECMHLPSCCGWLRIDPELWAEIQYLVHLNAWRDILRIDTHAHRYVLWCRVTAEHSFTFTLDLRGLTVAYISESVKR